jgi:hypothetical protein
MTNERSELEEHARLIQVQIAQYAAESFGYELNDCHGDQLREVIARLETYEDLWANYVAGGTMDSLLTRKFEARDETYAKIKRLPV